MIFLRKTNLDAEPMPIKMSGVRMGERLLQIGVDSPKLAGAMAAKVGLSGTAAIVVTANTGEARARAAAEGAGALVDIRVAALTSLPFEDGAFDVVVVNSMAGLLSALDAHERVRALTEAHRALRRGGRVILLEPGPREGLRGLIRPFRENPEYAAAGGGMAALDAAGFRPVRLLAERDGYRFAEGLKA